MLLSFIYSHIFQKIIKRYYLSFKIKNVLYDLIKICTPTKWLIIHFKLLLFKKIYMVGGWCEIYGNLKGTLSKKC